MTGFYFTSIDQRGDYSAIHNLSCFALPRTILEKKSVNISGSSNNDSSSSNNGDGGVVVV